MRHSSERFMTITFVRFMQFGTLCLLTMSASVFSAEIKFNKNNGLFQLEINSGVLIKSAYVGWGNGWKWDGPVVNKGSLKEGAQLYQLAFQKQGVTTDVKLSAEKNIVTYVFSSKFEKNHLNTIGGGIEFNLDLVHQKRNGGSEPILLPDGSGWVWQYEKNKKIEVRFTPGIAAVYFERGNKSRIRTLFFKGKITAGKSSEISMQLVVPRVSSIESVKNIYSTDHMSKWLPNMANPAESFIDISFLNEKPAGQHGFVRVENDYFKFSDGKIARFYGTNLEAYSLFINDKAKIKHHAKRIASLGFNLVRLHHHDSPWVSPNLISKGDTTQKIDTKALDNYFWWVKCLRDEGIYIWVDLQVQRPWREGDKIAGWKTDLAQKAKNGMNVAKGFIYLNERMQDLTKKFNEELLTRINPYTNVALKDDPAIMGVLITNENDLTFHFGNSFLKEYNHPYHQSLFEKSIDTFSKRTGLNPTNLRATWKPGASKYLLNDLEAHFNNIMIKHLRSIGVKVPIATTSLWGNETALYSLPALTTGDMVDAHGYTDDRALSQDPNVSPNFLHNIGLGQVENMPFTVSEYNVDEKSAERRAYIGVVSTAIMAAFQDWDAIMLYGYSYDDLRGNGNSPWSSYNHPSIIGLIPAMAMLYRQKHVNQARRTVVFSPSSFDLFEKPLSAKTSVAIRTTLEQHRMVVAMPKTKELPWLLPSRIDKNAIIINDFNRNMLPANQGFIVSDTGEVKRDWSKGIMTINTAKSQLVMGRIGGRKIKLDDVVVNAKTPEAAIIFTSLDNKSIRISKRILVSAVAKVAKVKRQWKTSYISEPVNAEITFKSTHKGLRLIALRPDGSEGRSLPLIKNSSGEYSFILSEQDKTHWYIIAL